MVRYYFNLKERNGLIVDPDGTELSSDEQAREHATQVAMKLMRHRGAETKAWRLQVCDTDRHPRFEVLFATLAADHLPHDLRQTVVGLSSGFASLYDTISDLRMTLRQIDTTMARAQGLPHLAALNGTTVAESTPEPLPAE